MSKKDIIIIAVLVNTGLLALLFMLAINTDEDISDKKISNLPTSNQIMVSDSAVPKSTYYSSKPQTVQVVDEVDYFLKELSSDSQGQTILVDEDSVFEQEQEVVPVKIKTPTQTIKITEKNESKNVSGEIRYVEVTVKRGDALEKIARNNGTTVEAIKQANGLNSAKLSIGQVLRVPVGKSSVDKPQGVETKSVTSKSSLNHSTDNTEPVKKVNVNMEPKYYTIKSGDNPWQIARNFQVKFEELLRLNDLDEEKARNLKVGDKLRVR